MTNPPEIHEHRTDTQKLGDDIATAVTNLARDWPHMIRPGETQAPGMASRSGVALDDHDPGDADQNRITKIISLRRLAQDQLADWCQLIIEDRSIQTPSIPCAHGISTRVTLNYPRRGPLEHPILTCDAGWRLDGRLHTLRSTDVPGMAAFIGTHAEWVSGHDAAQDCRDELVALAHRCHLIAAPKRRESMSIGRCPLQIIGEMDVLETCGGDVRMRLLPEEKPGEAYAACSRCGEVAVASWWAERMFVDGEGSPLVTAAELIAVIAYQLHIVVTHEQIRQWKHRTKIRAEGYDSKGRALYRHADVIDAMFGEARAKAGT